MNSRRDSSAVFVLCYRPEEGVTWNSLGLNARNYPYRPTNIMCPLLMTGIFCNCIRACFLIKDMYIGNCRLNHAKIKKYLRKTSKLSFQSKLEKTGLTT